MGSFGNRLPKEFAGLIAAAESPGVQNKRPRSSLEITLSVWKALFLREAMYRLLSSRSAPWWLLLEPVLHIAYMLVVYTVIRMRVMDGIDIVLWLLCGILAYLLFGRTFRQTTRAVDANLSLFNYRQVKPVDTLLVRAMLEFLILALVAIILFTGVYLFGRDIAPDDPLIIILALVGLWLFGLGWGMMASVAQNLIPELGNLNRIITMPLFILSGVIVPISRVPQPYREWLMLNPIAHGLELVRQGFSEYYHAVPETSLSYLYGCMLAFLFLGFALQRRYSLRLITQ